MEITTKKIKEIFDTLPTGYYIGRRLNVVFDENTDSSFYEPLADKVTISAKMIIDACKNATTTVDTEELVRGLLYHEVSHAMLTGKTGGCEPTHSYMREINILEDERIETLLKDYYMNTNFKSNIYLINNFKGEAAKNADEAFYHLVRFNIGPTEWINALVSFLDRYKHLNAISSYYDWYDYFADCIDFYKNFVNDYNNNPEKFDQPQTQNNKSQQSENNQNQSGNSSDSTEQSDKNNKSQPSNKEDENDADDENENNGAADNENDDSQSDASDEENETNESQPEANEEETNSNNSDNTYENDVVKSHGVGKGLPKDEIKKMAETVFNQYANGKLKANLFRILSSASYKKGVFEGSTRCYAGHIDPKACGRDDYKWFVKNTGYGDVNGISKIHLNLFIDNSGSWSADREINELIKALNEIKSPTFDFDVITINSRIVEWPTTTSYLFKSGGGTDLSNAIAGVIKRHTQHNAQNYNIVVFDGEAHSYGKYTENSEPFRHFNTPNSILVVDRKNECFINNLKNCRKKVISSNYAGNFINEVLKLLSGVIS